MIKLFAKKNGPRHSRDGVETLATLPVLFCGVGVVCRCGVRCSLEVPSMVSLLSRKSKVLQTP